MAASAISRVRPGNRAVVLQAPKLEAPALEDQHIPHLLGHEGGGEVVEIGVELGRSDPTTGWLMHWAEGNAIDSQPPRFSYKGASGGRGLDDHLGAYTIASENTLTPMPHGAPSDVLALLGCGVTTGLGIVFHNAPTIA